MKLVLLLSGGMDSTTLLYDLHDQGHTVYPITFYYGSRHNNNEVRCASYHVEHLDLVWNKVDISFLRDILTSALFGDSPMPYGHYDDASMKSTVVPFRNRILLSIATAYAESVGAAGVAIASHSGDHAIYPDCTPNFNRAMADAMAKGTYGIIQLYAPYEKLHKGEIASIGRYLGLNYNLTWTCYEGGKYPCGKCGACIERVEAITFAQAYKGGCAPRAEVI